MKLAGRFWVVAGAWLITRLVILAVWVPAIPELAGDVAYYWRNAVALSAGTAAPATVMVEYPTPVLWLASAVLGVSGGSETGFRLTFSALLVVLDLALTLLLWWGGRGGRGVVATWFWVVFVALSGPIVYLRLDLIPAVLSAAGLLALGARRPVALAGTLAAGAGLKFWPAFLLPVSLRGDRRQDAITASVFTAAGVVIAAASVAYGGLTRLVSPLAWQSARGLQVESVWATPLMIARVADPELHPVRYSPWQAYEVFGPGVDTLLTASTIATALSYLVFAAGYVFWLRRLYVRGDRPSPAAAGHLMVTVVVISLVVNKTLSPQYLLWVAALVAALLVFQPGLEALAGCVLVLAMLTQLVYPSMYAQLLAGGPDAGVAVALLALRNLGLVALCCWLVSRSVRLLASADL